MLFVNAPEALVDEWAVSLGDLLDTAADSLEKLGKCWRGLAKGVECGGGDVVGFHGMILILGEGVGFSSAMPHRRS
ncbi:MAG: hypothetical protein EA421_09750 [Gemmatimonadales bacterium]|nr:MAG: hypothetical protein EA421_09750 [Gemmatimonadales bacterium]